MSATIGKLGILGIIATGLIAWQSGNWGLGPIGTRESRAAPQSSRLARNHQNVNYDGRWTYARIAFQPQGGGGGGGFFGGRGGGDPMWDHDYPNSDRNFPTILAAITDLRARSDGSVILRSDDPDLFKYPFAYLCEVGSWRPSEPEVLGLRKYLQKGGFVLVDDFRGSQALGNFQAQMERVLPGVKLIEIPESNLLFDSFYRITDFSVFSGGYGGGGGFGGGFGGRGRGGRGGAGSNSVTFYGVFENNDPTGRLMMAVNYNYDVSELWEYSATGRFPVDETNEAYKLGVNYVIYSLLR